MFDVTAALEKVKLLMRVLLRENVRRFPVQSP
jgi:hypothetical protein